MLKVPRLPSILFCGPPGCGKSTLTLLLAKANDGPEVVIERCKNFEHRELLWESQDIRRGLTRENLTGMGRRVFVLGLEDGLTEAETAGFRATGFTGVPHGQHSLRGENATLLCLGLAWCGENQNRVSLPR